MLRDVTARKNGWWRDWSVEKTSTVDVMEIGCVGPSPRNLTVPRSNNEA